VAQDQRVEKLEKFLAQRGQPCTDRCRRQGGWRRKLLLLRTEAQAPADATAAVDLRNAWLAQTS
jgi:hypothetical protein